MMHATWCLQYRYTADTCYLFIDEASHMQSTVYVFLCRVLQCALQWHVTVKSWLHYTISTVILHHPPSQLFPSSTGPGTALLHRHVRAVADGQHPSARAAVTKPRRLHRRQGGGVQGGAGQVRGGNAVRSGSKDIKVWEEESGDG